MQVDIKVLDSRVSLPAYKTLGSAGMDLCAVIDEPLTLAPNEVKLVPTGIAVHLDNPNFVAMIMPRSSMGHKNGIILGNSVGVIDSDYQGQMMMSLWNRSDTPFTIEPMERVAQLLIMPVMQVSFNQVEQFPASERGEGGFGSTGKN